MIHSIMGNLSVPQSYFIQFYVNIFILGLGSAVAQLQDEHGIKSRSSRNSIKSSGYPSIDRHLSSAKDQVCV